MAQRSLAWDQWPETQDPLGFKVVEISWLLGSSPFLSRDGLYKGWEESVKDELGATPQLQVTRLTLASHLVIVHSCSRRSICSLLQNGGPWGVYLDAPLMWQRVRVFLKLSSPMLIVTLEESYWPDSRNDKIEAWGSETWRRAGFTLLYYSKHHTSSVLCKCRAESAFSTLGTIFDVSKDVKKKRIPVPPTSRYSSTARRHKCTLSIWKMENTI